jgi:catechol 2,3-dioxygenase-like lactoylglutathione lyase family enzyme
MSSFPVAFGTPDHARHVEPLRLTEVLCWIRQDHDLQGHVINYRVDDVDAIVARMQEDGVETSPLTVGPDAEGQGKFVRLLDPEGHRIELWEHLSDGS